MPYKYIKVKNGNAKWATNVFLSLLNEIRYHMKQYRKSQTPENWAERQQPIRIAKHMKHLLQKNHVDEALANTGNVGP